MTLADATVLYCAVLSAATAAALLFVRRSSGWFRPGAALGVLACVALATAAALDGGDRFQTLHLFSYGAFGFVPAFLAGTAFLLRRSPGRVAPVAAGAALLIAAVGADAFLVEPHWLQTTRHEIRSDKLRQALRIVVLADVQTDRFTDHERNAFRTALEQQPDLILMAGDYIQEHRPRRWEAVRDAIRAYLLEIGFRAPLGVFAVEGNTDSERWREIFEGLPVTTLHQTRTVRAGEVYVTGLAEAHSFRRSLRVEGVDGFHIVLGHSPDFALGDVDADLLVAGHTHGGQVRLPFLGPVITLSAVPRSWAAGLTELPGGGRLLVSRGVGMERNNAPRLRFLCRPEVVVLDVLPVADEDGRASRTRLPIPSPRLRRRLS